MQVPVRKPELLSPAGNQISLRAALDAGCDAVYFGVRGMNMRAGARNFGLDDLPDIVQECHTENAQAYLALNTMILEDDLARVQCVLETAAAAGVDAVIAWDSAVLAGCRTYGLEPHLSTQASVSNSSAIVEYHDRCGINRFVLARECTLNQIESIQNNLVEWFETENHPIELETFCHGAMCVSVSGRCFLSNYSFGQSANCGECIQPCRREYKIIDTDGEAEYVVGHDYIMSPNDLCTLPFIERLIGAGIRSLKIEGRNRPPEYVSTVTKAYRRAIDFLFDECGSGDFARRFEQVKKRGVAELKTVYNRGFSTGFYHGKPLDQWTSSYGNRATRTKEFVGRVRNYYQKIQVAEIQVQSHPFSVGDEIMFQGENTGVVRVEVNSIEVEHERVQDAGKGTRVAVRVDDRVRVNDEVYVFRTVSEAEVHSLAHRRADENMPTTSPTPHEPWPRGSSS